VDTSGSTSIVVRLGATNQHNDLLGALHWSRILRPLGVPLPALLGHGDYRGYPYLILERLEGHDLGQVYHSSSSPERRSIAEEVCRIQRIVGTLPDGAGYGYLRLSSEPGHASWRQVIEASLARSRHRIEAAGLLSPSHVDRVAAHVGHFQRHFSRVRPVPFLDDVTTRNVLVHDGHLSGIVDVDQLCFGDSLFTIGLTRTALLSSGADPDYTDHWCNVLDLDGEQRRVVLFYTAVFCVDFMGEFGQHFSQGVVPHDPKRIARLETLLDEHLNAVA
jgi:aminoglycoside phosphotransferase (APT) family kinase protein